MGWETLKRLQHQSLPWKPPNRKKINTASDYEIKH